MSSLALAFFSCLWSFEGWNSLNAITEEVVQPEKTMPKVILTSIFAVTIIYLLVNVSYFTFLTLDQIKTSGAIAVLYSKIAFESNKFLQLMIPMLVFLSAAGTYNSSLLLTSRIFMVAGRDQMLPTWFALSSKSKKTPCISIFCCSLMTTLYLLPTKSDYDHLVAIFGFTNLIFYGTTYLSIFWLRKLEPLRKRPFQINLLIPISMSIISYGLVFVPLVLQPKFEYIYVLVLFVIGLTCYYFLIYRGLPIITIQNNKFENYLINKFNLVKVANEYNENTQGVVEAESTYRRFDVE